ncbi:Ribonuclease H [Pseudocercospora fuligena]|uniref:Ribonuclease H n=1 Tax=Pseudocercospora fuligena TaxID=685502 RepID=A0A8H6VRC3_9PEZI|nr:Ribonuclease H [Pseudocercospora fuligena]
MSSNVRQTRSRVQRSAVFKNARKFPAPINSSPSDLFTYPNPIGVAGLYYRRGDHRTMLIFVAGSCVYQTDFYGNIFIRAGCAWIFRPPPHPDHGRINGIHLEQEGPWHEEHPVTSHRAELRAAIGALQCGRWYNLGMKNIVIASCSDYLVLGITEKIEVWREQGWRDTSGTVIANLDLWKALLCEIDHYSDFDTKVYFWKIGDNDNTEAHAAARSAAILLPDIKQYSGVVPTYRSGD